jgi:hypothetical protein
MSTDPYRRNPPPTRGSDQDADVIMVGSPLAVVGVFVETLRARFSAGNGPSDWPWSPNLNDTKIVIESGFASPGNTERGKKPAIFVDKDESVYGKVIIGDRVGINWQNMADYQWTLSTVPIIIECVAAQRGTSAIIGDVVQWTLHCASDPIQAAFAFHDMTPPTLGRTVPYEAEKESWLTPVSFQVQYNVRWSITPIGPLMQEIRTRIRHTGAEANEHLVEVASFGSGNLSEQ